MKQLKDLPEDIYKLFLKGVEPKGADLEKFGNEVALAIKMALRRPLQPKEPFRLRMSNLGKPARQLWYDAHYEGETEGFTGPNLVKFIYGNILEALVLFLAKVSGHEVHSEQRECEVRGVRGSMDGYIDGVLVDVKSASSRSFDKFSDGSLRRDDPFGYLQQLTGYANADGAPDSAFVGIDKTLGKICVMPVPSEEVKLYDTEARIDYLRGVLESPTPPDKCYDPKPEGTSGNYILPSGCAYCKHKFHCHSDTNGGLGLQTYLYSTGPKYFTTIIKEPKVPKIEGDKPQ